MGRDKATLRLGGMTLLERTLAGVPDDVDVVVAGDQVPLSRAVTFVREEPAGGGPVAGVDAALAAVHAPAVVILATDLPLLGTLPVRLATELWGAGREVDAVIVVDRAGRLQQLCAAYRTDALRAAIAAGGVASGASMRSVVDRLELRTTMVSSAAASDVDTPADLAAVQAALDRESPS